MAIAILMSALSVAGALSNHPRWVALGVFVVIVALFLEYGIAQAVVQNIRRKWVACKDRRTLLAAGNSFRDHVASFEVFVRTDSANLSLCNILNSHLCGQFNEVFGSAPPLDPTILHSIWTRVSAHTKSLREPEDFELAVEDFATLLDLYSDRHLRPIFDTCSDPLRRTASPDLLRRLSAAREKYVLFLDKYVVWLTEQNQQLKVKMMRLPNRGAPLPL